MKSKAWYALFPMDAYALGPFRFEMTITEKQFKKYLRKWEGVTRLPRSIQIWPTK